MHTRNLILLCSEHVISDGTAAKVLGVCLAALTLVSLLLLHAADLKDGKTAELVPDPHPGNSRGVPLTCVRVCGILCSLQTAGLQQVLVHSTYKEKRHLNTSL